MKLNKIFMYVCLVSLVLVVVTPGFSVAAPSPDIKANGSDTDITINSSDTLSITASLNAADSAGTNADWWAAAYTPFGWYYFNAYSWSWQTGLNYSYQGALFTFPSSELLNISGLPDGTYFFYFGVDTVMNGLLDFNNLYYDWVAVTVATVPQQDLTGTWSGIWSDGYEQGGVTVNFIQNGSSLSGTATIANTPCISAGNISGSIEGNTISFGAVSATQGEGTILFSGVFTSTTMSGTYFIQSGECAGEGGTFSLTKQ
jgi:hypothetical protein